METSDNTDDPHLLKGVAKPNETFTGNFVRQSRPLETLKTRLFDSTFAKSRAIGLPDIWLQTFHLCEFPFHNNVWRILMDMK